MSIPLAVLLVEDSVDDAELLVLALRACGFAPTWTRVETETDFIAGLGAHLDVIFSDFNLPQFTISRALELLRERQSDVPFIVVSGTIGDDQAVECVKAGATDYILKDRLQRLGPAVKRALRETEQKRGRLQAEDQLRIQAAALANAADSIFITDTRGAIIWTNPAFTTLSGYAADEIIGKNPRLLKSGSHDSLFYQRLWETILVGKTWRGEFTNRRKDGTLYYGEQTITPVRSEEGKLTHFVGIMNDVTERKRAEESLKLFRALIDRSNDGFEVIDPETARFLDVNQATCERHGYTREEMLGLRLLDVEATAVNADSWAQLVQQIRAAGFMVMEGRHRRKDGSTFSVEVNVRYIHLDRPYLVAVVRDITERRLAEQALRESEARFRELAENIAEVFWITDPAKQQMLYVSPAYERIWGRTCQSLYDRPQSWLESIHPDDRERVAVAVRSKQVAGTYDEEYRIVRPAGALRWIRDRAFPVRNAAGQIERIVGVAEDITERRQLEEQFRQSQKMEAVGQLAGGVAHDFNNILTAILMHLGLLRAQPELAQGMQETLHELEGEARRATALTRQLLLFSRRQVMQPRDLDLNEVVTSLAKMLQRIIGEDVKLQLHLHGTPLITRADAGMLDQVLLNLAVNARDAMPGGGRLLIETAEKIVDDELARFYPDVAPGRYVWLSVSDTGTGIPPEILSRIFEPFFTTKEPGKGTGLGLASVFGIVKQHRGWIKAYSEPGQGANFQIFLPASATTPKALDLATLPPQPRGGTEIILLVEDEARVRTLTRLVLERAGYQVLEAPHGVLALQVWEREAGRVDLLLTDIVMPEGLSGRQLAQQLQQRKPKLKVIFTSGYSAEIAGRELKLEEGQNFIQKPCSPAQLLQTVRHCLDS